MHMLPYGKGPNIVPSIVIEKYAMACIQQKNKGHQTRSKVNDVNITLKVSTQANFNTS